MHHINAACNFARQTDSLQSIYGVQRIIATKAAFLRCAAEAAAAAVAMCRIPLTEKHIGVKFDGIICRMAC